MSYLPSEKSSRWGSCNRISLVNINFLPPLDYKVHNADLEFSLELFLICSVIWDYFFHFLSLHYKMRKFD